MTEWIREVDKNDRVLRLRPRSEFYTGELIHRAVHLILLNSRSQILLQKRAARKRWYPSLYDFAVGGTVGDESYKTRIKREIGEELGVSIPVKKAFKYFTTDPGKDSAFRVVFVGRAEQELIPNEERESLRWFSQEELKEDIAQNPRNYTPHLIKGLEIFFKI